MSVSRDNIRGTIRLDRIDPNLCWGTPKEFVQKLLSMLSVDLGVPVNNEFVFVSHQTPTEDDKNKLWIRLARNGSFLGFFLFQTGAWKRIDDLRSDMPRDMIGDSREIERPWELIDEGIAGFDADTVSHLKSFYQVDNAKSTPGETVYKVFKVRWIGF